MPARALPARANLDHLKNEAKALRKAFNDRDTTAIARVRDTLGELPALKLIDAQRVVAREYGFPTWAGLRSHVWAMRGVEEAVSAFLDAVQQQDAARAKQVLATTPAIATTSVHVAATLGRSEDVARFIAEDRESVSSRVGRLGGDPLLYLCFSPFHGESAARDAGLVAAARLLLASGADPNTRDVIHGVTPLYAVTGQRSVLPIARLLLDAGANPTDGESVHHSAERFHEDALDLLLAAGADLNATGDWGNTPLYFLLRWYELELHPTVRKGVEWLLQHGADPDVRSGKERETALHLAARTGQSPATVQLLLDHGADVHATRPDGRTAWMLAARAGADRVAATLEEAGAEPTPLSPTDELLAACGRGDSAAARALTSPQLIDALSPDDLLVLPRAAAAATHDATVIACVAARFPVNTVDETGATALHFVAIRARLAPLRALLKAGARFDILDREHNSTALGWACFGADFVRDAEGDYVACVRALVEAGARFVGDEHRPRDAGVRLELARARLA